MVTVTVAVPLLPTVFDGGPKSLDDELIVRTSRFLAGRVLEALVCSFGDPPVKLRSLWELCWLSLLWLRLRFTDPEMVRFPPAPPVIGMAPMLRLPTLLHSDGGLLSDAGESSRRPSATDDDDVDTTVFPQLIFDFTSLKFFLITALFSAILLITASHLFGVADFFVKLRFPTLALARGPPQPPRVALVGRLFS